MESNEEKQLDIDNKLILSAEQALTTPEKPVNEEIKSEAYNSANDTGNSNEDLELSPDDNPETNVDEYDLEALNGEDMESDDL